MKAKYWAIIILSGLAFLACAVYFAYPPVEPKVTLVYRHTNNMPAPSIAPTKSLTSGTDASISGIVIKNSIEVGPVDGAAYLVIRTVDYGDITVDYSPSIQGCLGKADNSGFGIKPGDKVSVKGTVFINHIMDICESKNYYIKKQAQN